jgi:hypothetical protein
MTVEQQTDEATALRTLVKLCQQDKLLERPQGLEEGDSAEGLNDEGTLLYETYFIILDGRYILTTIE